MNTHFGNITLILTPKVQGGFEILLGHKPPEGPEDAHRSRRRVGMDKWVPQGGKKEATDESDVHGAQREVLQEAGYDIPLESFADFGVLDGYFGEDSQGPTWSVRLYRIIIDRSRRDSFRFSPEEFDDMRWFDASALPWNMMMPADEQWIPHIIAGTRMHVSIRLDSSGNRLISCEATPLV